MNIRLKFEILTFSAAPETHFESIPMLRGAKSTFVYRPLWFSTLQIKKITVILTIPHAVFAGVHYPI